MPLDRSRKISELENNSSQKRTKLLIFFQHRKTDKKFDPLWDHDLPIKVVLVG